MTRIKCINKYHAYIYSTTVCVLDEKVLVGEVGGWEGGNAHCYKCVR